ncbi:ATP-binding cassette containing protein [Colletotrichum truncatum]|uniref:ATP-binding cassette containing protein n=1 Tax=Colletotrichum truncatum TaxID=5467 RepID=A0ACC3YJZ9_COLTU
MDTKLHDFSIAASILFLSLLPFRLFNLHHEKVKTVPGYHGLFKLTLAVALVALQSIIVATTVLPVFHFNIEFLSTIVTLAAFIGLCPLVFLEHARSIKPSDLVVIYLLVLSAYDSLSFGKAFLANEPRAASSLAASSLCLKLLLLAYESQGKEKLLREPRGQWSPEQLAGVLNRLFFWWINTILRYGNRNILNGDKLPPIDDKLSSDLLRRQALKAWDQRAKPERKTTLPRVLLRSMLSHFVAPVIPRLSLIAFRYAQPILISTAIRYMSNSPVEDPAGGYSVILMAVAVYISSAMYSHSLNRLKIMIRGAVVGLINNKSLRQRSGGYDDGRAVTLITTDAESIGQTARMFHETWAQVIEVVVGTVMLAGKVGWVCLVPFGMIFFCSRMSRYLAKNLQGRQKNWNAATQERLATITSMLASMKSLKMLGVSTYTESLVCKLRLRELEMANKVRWMMVAYNASANALGIFSPIITLVLYALLAKWNGSALDTETAFTTTALLGLVTHPANMIMTIIPQAVGALAAYERVQDFLLEPPRSDQRLLLQKTDNGPSEATPAIRVNNVTINPTPSAAPILENINFVINKGSLVMCSGPVASGKSAIIKAILGELPTTVGEISVSSKRIGYCEQSPWLPSGTVKDAICGFLPEDATWYERVLQLCCLKEDILSLPNGDHTMIGSRGLNLSGGQRQRVAIARAVYSRCDIVLLDDSFSALDGKTETRIADNLLGLEGYFRKAGTAVLFITNSTAHFHLADELIILGSGSVQYQGTWKNLAQKPDGILKFNINDNHNNSIDEDHQLDKTMQSKNLKVAEATCDLKRATGDVSLYDYYFRAVGFRNILLLLICTSLYSFFITFPQYLLQKWTEAPASQTTFYIGGYLISSLLAWISTNGSMWSTHIRVAPESGAELHRRLLSTIIGAPLLYFSATDNGVILNRFSQDIQMVDRQLPPAILSLSNQIFKLLVQTSLLFSAQKLMASTLPLCIIVVYIVQKVYLRTSRQLRLLDLESQSAVYSSFLESTEGITTIRSFGLEKQVEDANIRCLDKSQQPAYILSCLQQWLCVVLDLMVAAIATGLIALAVLMRGTTTAGQIGMALNLVLVANSTLLSLVSSWTNLEISLGAISRLKNLEAETPKEDKPHENYKPAKSWPSSGVVQLDNVTVAYNPDALALENISLKVSAGQQLIVCGRTGSGKSTLLLTLLRLLDLKSGSIKIDGVDISLIPRSLVRQQCFITISQDPFSFGQASLRFNLDPSGSLSDEALVSALQKTSLWTHFESGHYSSMSSKGGQILDCNMSSLPQMSTGQSQLFAVARAILQLQALRQRTRPSESEPTYEHVMPILLLDEATSSLDSHSESAIRSIIHQEFTEKGHTVIAIAHRLNGIDDKMRTGQDIVALFSKGKVEKIGNVNEVLGTTDLHG